MTLQRLRPFLIITTIMCCLVTCHYLNTVIIITGNDLRDIQRAESIQTNLTQFLSDEINLMISGSTRLQ